MMAGLNSSQTTNMKRDIMSNGAVSTDGFSSPMLVVEDDPWTRLIGVVLDPATSQKRRTAFATSCLRTSRTLRACDALRARRRALSQRRAAGAPQAELRDNLAAAQALVDATRVVLV
jgi:mRNA-degrading endonuclease toxin of MazEF toxin-antitoxin module